MHPPHRPLACLAAALVLLGAGACAGPSTPSAPARRTNTTRPAKPVAEVRGVFVVTFDAAGNAIGDDRTTVTREHVIALMSAGTINRNTVIHIQVPKDVPDQDRNIAAFLRAQQVAKIFNILGFTAVQIAVAKQ